jgi:hypothetical protein
MRAPAPCGEGLGEGEGLGDAVGLGEGLAVGLGLGVAVGLGEGVGVGVCQALTVEELKTNRVRRSMIPAAPLCKFIDCILLFRKLMCSILSTQKKSHPRCDCRDKLCEPHPQRRTTFALPRRCSLQPLCQIAKRRINRAFSR